jgi:hypothetical protein
MISLDQPCPIVCPKLLACSIRVILDYLRRRSAASRDLCRPEAIGQMLQYLHFSCTQGLHQSVAPFESHLETSSTRTLNCVAVLRGVMEGPE